MIDNEMPKKTFSWKRFFRYWYVRLLRINDNPRSIALGVGLGLFIGFIVPIGLQTVAVLPVAFIFKANKILSIAFTWVTNYVTVIFIYPIQCYVGSVILFHPIKLEALKETFKGIESWKDFGSIGGEIIVAFFAGGLLLGLVTGIAGYCLSYGAIIRYKESKRQRMRQKLMSRRES